MNKSFELLSSMSPKITKRMKPPKNLTKLALKKYFRRSASLPKGVIVNKMSSTSSCSSIGTSNSSGDESVDAPAVKPDLEGFANLRVLEKSVIEIHSSSSSSGNSCNEPIVVSDSDKSPIVRPNQLDKRRKGEINETKSLSVEKYNNIKEWLNEVDSAKSEISTFSSLSTIIGESGGFKRPNPGIAASSTYVGSSLNTRFDELFSKNKDKGNKSNETKNNSLISEDLSYADKAVEDLFYNMTLDDSLDELWGKGREIHSDDTKDCESLLDSIYGDSWRDKRHEVLPLSAPRVRKNQREINKAPNTDKPAKTKFSGNFCMDKPLFKTLQQARFNKALESPWKSALNNLCDSDTGSDCDDLAPIKLNFDEPEDKQNSNLLIEQPNEAVKPLCKNYSFLASLSGGVPASKCHISALIYRNNFKPNREDLAGKLFELYNEKIFEKSIPKDTPIEWNDRMRRTAGFCHCKKIIRRTGATERVVRIVLSTKVIDSADRLRDTLVHEMCHAVTWIVNQVSDGHGSFWKSWADRAMQTFPELPPIKRCHQYVINTKYTYRCEGCGYCIGRHTKSLDTERKRCGYCFGKFEVLINKTSKKGETKTVPATPKKPSGFALFVKENYGAHKTADLKHAEIMKLLGQKFAELKCEQAP